MNRKQRRIVSARSKNDGLSTPKARLLDAAVTAHQAGRLEEAETLYKRVLSMDPADAGCVHHLGLIAHQRLNHHAAIELIQKAISLRPDYAEAHSNLSIVLAAAGDLAAAVSSARKAVALRPGNAHSHAALGSLLFKQGHADDALGAYQMALRLDPQRAETHFLLGELLRDRGDVKSSVDSYRRAIQFDRSHQNAHLSLGEACSATGQYEEALSAYAIARQLSPGDSEAMFAQAYLKRQVCEWPAPVPGIADPERAEIKPVPPFSILAAGGDMQAQLAWARKWSRDLEAACEMRFSPELAADRAKIRVGYLSADFHEHATAYLACELFEMHDRNRFEVYGYSIGQDDGSGMRARLERAFDHFTDLRGKSHLEAAQLIHGDSIDILIDLKGYTRGARTQILAYRPAPIQVNYLGYPGTMGAGFIDYIVGDETVIPACHEPFYSEKVIRLPGSYQPNSHRLIDDHIQSRNMHGLPEDAFVFCCFNNTYKITEQVFDVWMRILKGVDRAVLWLFDSGSQTRENLRKAALERGVSPERLVFAPKLPLASHLARHIMADLFLDTVPVNAHTTASDALWAGLPVLTCLGDTFAGRVAASLNNAVGLYELVAHSLQEYEALAISLAEKPDQIAAFKLRLVEGRRTAALFNMDRYVQGLEDAFAEMVRAQRIAR
ncbi:TPR repeat-containing protein yrrB [Pannonibacter phragmitetus]|uniref:protein O-GlcNAc transferase n=1 Tax=Pannonibacter phragmitetus TaxID=121719 RepID=A0A378ZZR9_9HYPH|nr:tetratricopeptide repeat protein [Pannonibacter phragmitetus]SUB02031.1 TPR repeat-containing protein yrrB [Pannonibacter phragmitetus]